MNTQRIHSRRQQGFSLVEVSLAVGILAISMIALAGMIPTSHSIMQDSGVRAQLNRFQGLMRDKLNGTGYAKVTQYLDAGSTLYLYQYLSGATVRADGSGVPSSQGDPVLPVAAARWENDALLSEDTKAILGPLFRVKLERFPTVPATVPATVSAIPVWAVVEQIPSASVGGKGKFVARKPIFIQP